MSIIFSLIIFSAIVTFHELGHFLLARLSGIKVVEFSLGMGPRLLSTTRGETIYSLKALPLGGSCAMLGEDASCDLEGSFNNAPVGRRIAVVAAGPVFNIILAFAAGMLLVALSGYMPAVVGQVDEGSSVYQAGLRPGDEILSYDGRSITMADDLLLYESLYAIPSKAVVVDYKREGELYTLTYTPESTDRYMIGISYDPACEPATLASVTLNGAAFDAGLQPEDVILEIDGTVLDNGTDMENYLTDRLVNDSEMAVTYLRKGRIRHAQLKPQMVSYATFGFQLTYESHKATLPQLFQYGWYQTRYMLNMTFASLRMLFTGQVSMDQMSGPVGIVETIGTAYDSTRSLGVKAVLETMLSMALLLSANLGVMNLLPLPALDGGRLVFMVLELIRRKPLDQEIEGRIHLAGFMLLMALILYVTIHDVMKFF